MATRPNEQLQTFRFDTVEIFQGDDNALGIGSYGAVFKARCDQLQCAAKILHPILFQSNDPASSRILDRFRQECTFMSSIRHPNIVQYLGATIDPQTGLPVLLMELLDESLTKYLERSTQSLPYCIEVDLSHDVTLALAYLHSNHIVHRDLSSNNVLILAGKKAKVTDFGMSRILNEERLRRLGPTLTQLPGTEVYMPPESFVQQPEYDNKMDMFSYGVLLIQVMTRKFPNPTTRMILPATISEQVQIIPDRVRRKSHIDLIDQRHTLLEIAHSCLNYEKVHRPTAQETCTQLAALKVQPKYMESKEAGEVIGPVDTTHLARVQQLEGQVVELQQQITRKDAEMAHNEQQLREAFEQFTAKDGVITDLRQQVHDHQQLVSERDSQIEELRQELQQLRTGSGDTSSTRGSFSINWQVMGIAPTGMACGACTVRGDVAYIQPAGKTQIYTYTKSKREWSELVKTPYNESALVFVDERLTVIGGKERQEDRNNLLTYTSRKSREWEEHWPPMTHNRSSPATACNQSVLIVAGGSIGHNAIGSVEILDLKTRYWHEVEDLPHPLSHASANICNESIYLVGGWYEQGEESKSVFTCEMSSLAETRRPIRWRVAADLPKANAVCTTVGRRLVAVGGREAGLGKTLTDKVYAYNPSSNEWESANAITIARSGCFVLNFEDKELFVIGGYVQRRELTDSIESTPISYC